MNKTLIITAGGTGSRFGSKIPKQFFELNDFPVIFHSIKKFIDYDKNIRIIICINQDFKDYFLELTKKHQFNINFELVNGGETRFHSIKNATNLLDNNGLCAVHDAVRPFVSKQTIKKCFEIAEKKGNAVPYKNINESIRIIEENTNKAFSRNKIVIIQTPQIFQNQILKKAYNQEFDIKFTDDASLVENLGYTINFIKGNKENIKITYKNDFMFLLYL